MLRSLASLAVPSSSCLCPSLSLRFHDAIAEQRRHKRRFFLSSSYFHKGKWVSRQG